MVGSQSPVLPPPLDTSANSLKNQLKSLLLFSIGRLLENGAGRKFKICQNGRGGAKLVAIGNGHVAQTVAGIDIYLPELRENMPNDFDACFPVIDHFLFDLVDLVVAGNDLNDEGWYFVGVRVGKLVNLLVRQPADVRAAVVGEKKQVWLGDELTFHFALNFKAYEKICQIPQKVKLCPVHSTSCFFHHTSNPLVFVAILAAEVPALKRLPGNGLL